MGTRRTTRRHETQLAFEALSIEGALLSADWLARAAQLSAGGQNEADYRIPKGLNLRDEIGRHWRIAQAHWREFAGGLAAKADSRALAERFVHGLLRESFGFASLVKTPPVVLAERSYPIGAAALSGHVPVVVAPADSGLDTLSAAFGDGGRRRSAFGLAQEFLNASDAAVWGLASDGVTLRILRDNASLTRPAWVEADLRRIFTEERYSDFAALWLVAHETRFGAGDRPASEAALETWRASGREEGTRAREHLRRGVEDALVALGTGFLAHPENQLLRSALESGTVAKDAYFQELLRLVYRLIFLLTAEERGVLQAPGAPDSAKSLYTQGYGVRRLRDRAVRRSGYDRFTDLWDALKIVLRGMGRGEERLGLPALGGLFDEDQCPSLDAAKLENRALLHAIFRLSWLREDGSLSRVNWRDMGPEELGSVYESLLELVPQITDGGRKFAFATGAETKGNARKTTGSYYTPDSLVQVLLDSALEPVVQDTIAKNPEKPVEALLNLSIVDPACGSGHFLLSAARRLAAHVARIEANGTPSADQYRHALRQVVGRCIFGVDLNPMAVELCKVSLWMEALEPGRPLSFLDSHIQHGNALLGATPELLAQGIPDTAWDPIEGDDKKIASALKKQNKADAKAQSLDFSPPLASTYARLGAGARAVDDAVDESLDAIEAKERTWRDLLASAAYEHQRLVADLWCAAFVWQKQPGALRDLAPTDAVFRAVQRDGSRAPRDLRIELARLRDEYQFFHWHLAFPQVSASGGFDVVLGNPPWEKVKLQEQEFFASRNNEIATAANASTRKRLIAKLPEVNPKLWGDWCAASRKAEGESHAIRHTGRYPLCGRGDVNTYAIFAEHNRSVLGPRGRAGFIVPSGLATDDTTADFFAALVEEHQLASFYSFENEAFVFPAVHHSFKFALLTIDGAGEVAQADLLFFARQVSDLDSIERHFTLSPADFLALNPNSRTCPTFRSRRDAELNIALYKRTGVLLRDDVPDGDPWHFRIHSRLWHMAEDADAFRTADQLLRDGWRPEGNRFVRGDAAMAPLFEAKMLHQFDHRFGTYDGQSESQGNQGKLPEFDDNAHRDPNRFTMSHYWVDAGEADRRLTALWARGWLLGWRKIARSTDQRTVIAVLFPRAAAGDATPLAFPAVSPPLVAALYANLCSYALDYCARQKVGGTNVTFNYVRQFPVLPPASYAQACPWLCETSLVDWLLPRVLELAYTAWDLASFAHDVGHNGPPFRWDPDRRFLLRCELDAAFFHLYGLARDDTDYVMDTFPIVRKNDEKAHGEYRTKRVILEIFDALGEAARIGRPYKTRLDPAPADPRVAHQSRFVVPAMPIVPATLPVEEDLARFVWAALHACGGSVGRTMLARAYSLRSQPAVLRRLTSSAAAPVAEQWSTAVAARVTSNALLPLLTQLEARGAVRFDVRAGEATVELGPSTPAADQIGAWHDFEARLVLNVLTALGTPQLAQVDAGLSADARGVLLTGATA